MKSVYTPKQISRAIDVSESSIKRWCDKGVISTQYTAGGHRRIAMASLVDFLRGSKHKLTTPEALGLPPTSGQTERVVHRSKEQFGEALLAGDQALCWQIALDLYLAGHKISVICDEVLAAAVNRIGDQWSCGEAEVYQERYGCQILLRVIHELRSLLPPLDVDAPLALGGAPAGDPYALGTHMAELVLCDSGWNAATLGENLPFDTFAAAIREKRPRLFWLSVSHMTDQQTFLDGYSKLHAEFAESVAFVVGGKALTDDIRQQMQFAAYCDSMQHLQGFAETLRQPNQPPTNTAETSQHPSRNGS